VTSLSVLARGSLDDKLRWTFDLYDLDGDGVVSKAELQAVVAAIYNIMGRYASPPLDATTIRRHVDRVFQVIFIFQISGGGQFQSVGGGKCPPGRIVCGQTHQTNQIARLLALYCSLY
jgi:hypothetical protein